MGSESYLKDFVRSGSVEDRALSRRPTVINQEKVDEVNDLLQTYPGSSSRSVVEVSLIPQTTTYRIRTEHLSLKPYKGQFVQQLCGKDFQDRIEICQMLLSLLTKPRNKNSIFLFG